MCQQKCIKKDNFDSGANEIIKDVQDCMRLKC